MTDAARFPEISGSTTPAGRRTGLPAPGSEAYRLAFAESFLRVTPHLPEFTALRLGDRPRAVEAADLIIERESLRPRLRSDPSAARRMDELADRLQNYGFSFRHIIAPRKTPANTGGQAVKKLAEPPLVRYSPAGESFLPPDVEQQKETAAEASAPPSRTASTHAMPSGILDEENLLLLEVTLGKRSLGAGLTGYQKDDTVVLGLADLAAILDFPIRVSAPQGTADGWFISEDRTFSLDLDAGQAKVNGEVRPFPPGSVIPGEDDLFVDKSLLEKWFGLGLSLSVQEMALSVTSRDRLPIEDRLARGYRRSLIQARRGGPDGPGLPFEPTPYRMFAPPFTDLTLTGSVLHREDPNDDDSDLRYTLISRGDLAYMTSELYLTGESGDNLNLARFNLSRTDPGKELLGPLKASRFEVGDVRPTRFPVLGGKPLERGVSIENRDIYRSHEFDTTRLFGPIPVGWEVELYRNKNLIESQVAGPDGEYDFDEVPVFFGKNVFRLEFYGPQGQRRSEEKTVIVGEGLVKKGDSAYKVTVSQKGEQTLPVQDLTDREDDGAGRITALYEYGISNGTSLSGGVFSTRVEDERHDYLTAGLRASTSGYFGQIDFLQDTRGGSAVSLLSQTALGPVDIRAKHESFFDFEDESLSGSSDPLRRRFELAARGESPAFGFLPRMPQSLSLVYADREDATETALSHQLSAQHRNLFVTHNLSAAFEDRAGPTDTRVDGVLQAGYRLGPMQFRGRLNYDVEPYGRVDGIELSDLWLIDPDLTTEFKVTRDLMDRDVTEGSVSLNWEAGRFTLSPSFSYDSEGDWRAFATLNFSLGMDPRDRSVDLSSDRRSNTGAVSAFVYHDMNNNGARDDGEPPVEGAQVRASQFGRKALTDADGRAFLTGLPVHRETDVVLDPGTPDNPFFEPTRTGKSILPRPGSVHAFDFPVILPGEIDGTVFKTTATGEQKPAANVALELVDREGKLSGRARSEFDGFYLFDKVPPGDYDVRIAANDPRYHGFTMSPVDTVHIGPEGDVVSGIDLAIRGTQARAAETTAPAEPTAIGTATALEKPTPAQAATSSNGPAGILYGAHLASYRTPEAAAAALDELVKRHPELTGGQDLSIRRVDLGPGKGVWHRILSGAFTDKNDAAKLCAQIRQREPYAAVVPIGGATPFSVHISSFRDPARAEKDAGRLAGMYGGRVPGQRFFTRKVDLGPEKGVWHRVLAGRFATRKAAERVAALIGSREPYCMPCEMKEEGSYGVHTASFKSMARALKGVGDFLKDFGGLLEDGSVTVRRVDLGPEKGVWHRVIAGAFRDRESAARFAERLRGRGAYAQPLPLE